MPAPVTNMEQQLIRRLSKGDEQAFKSIYEQYRDKVYSYARHLTKSIEQSEEVVQEVFLKLWLYRDKLAEVESFPDYLHLITRNHTLTCLKRQAQEQKILKTMGEKEIPAHNETEQSLLFNEYRDLIYEAISQLPDQQRRVYQLNKQQGYSTKEIAGQLGITQLTAKTHLVRAMRGLRLFLSRRLDKSMLVVLSILLRV